MKFFTLAAATLALSLSMVVSDAEAAKRLGGGRDTGMQRQSTTDKAPANTAPGQAPNTANATAAAPAAAAAARAAAPSASSRTARITPMLPCASAVWAPRWRRKAVSMMR